MLGNCYYNLGQFELALQFYEQAVSLKPDYAEAHLWAGNSLYKSKKYAEAIPHYQEAARLPVPVDEAEKVGI